MSVLATRRMLRKTNVSFDEDEDPRELLEMDGIEETTITHGFELSVQDFQKRWCKKWKILW